MKSDELFDYDDVGTAVREGRELRRARAYRIRFAGADLDFRVLEVPDPVPLGRQILAAAGFGPRDGCSLFAILQTGDFEEVRLDEPFDLRGRGAERFVGFQTDREFKLTLDDAQIRWGESQMKGSALYVLASVGNERDDKAVFLDVRGGEDRLIEKDELIDLTEPGIERFITAPAPAEIIVNGKPRTVRGRSVTFEQAVELAFPGKHADTIVFSMTYRHAASEPYAGELGPSGTVKVKPAGTVFNVTRTDKS